MEGWTVKLMAAATLSLSGAAGGRALGMARQMRVKQLHLLCQGLENLMVNMLERLLPLQQALLESGCPGLALVARGLGGDTPSGAWQKSLPALTGREGPYSCLEEEELSLVQQLFSSIGATGAARQRLLLKDIRESLEKTQARARHAAQEQARLYGSLGLLLGLAAAICLL